MLGIPREVAKHELRILPGSKPVQQRLCHFDDERRRAIGEEIAKLLAAGFIKEVDPSDWLSNCYRHKLTGLINGPKASWA